MNTNDQNWHVEMPSIGPTHIDLNLETLMIGPNTSIGFEQIRGKGLFSLRMKSDVKLASSITEVKNGLELNIVDLNSLEGSSEIATMLLTHSQIEVIKSNIDMKLQKYST